MGQNSQTPLGNKNLKLTLTRDHVVRLETAAKSRGSRSEANNTVCPIFELRGISKHLMNTWHARERVSFVSSPSESKPRCFP